MLQAQVAESGGPRDPPRGPFKGEPLFRSRNRAEPQEWWPYWEKSTTNHSHVALLRARIGHTLTNGHLGRFHITTNECPYCQDVEGSTEHILLECGALEETLGPDRLMFAQQTGLTPWRQAVWGFPDPTIRLLRKASRAGIKV